MRMIDIDERMPLIKAIKGWVRTEDERKLVQIVINTLEAAKTVGGKENERIRQTHVTHEAI